jgi:hypothetical protein
VLGIQERENIEELYIFPNPTSDMLTIQSSSIISMQCMILDIFGKVVKEFEGNEVSVHDLVPGTYFLNSPSFHGRVLKFIRQ